jgi:hypothetical protein
MALLSGQPLAANFRYFAVVILSFPFFSSFRNHRLIVV